MLQLKHGGEVKVIIIHCSFNSMNLEGNEILVLESLADGVRRKSPNRETGQ